ncbi:MAG: hypothetical protein FWC26_01135, partial [Fibromonadales bacterium]|nr:hypothetical protein [Fibromonadales bacterium]
MAQAVSNMTGTVKAVLAGEILTERTVLDERINLQYSKDMAAGDGASANVTCSGFVQEVEGDLDTSSFSKIKNYTFPVTLNKYSTPGRGANLDLSTVVKDFKQQIKDPVVMPLVAGTNRRTAKAAIGGISMAFKTGDGFADANSLYEYVNLAIGAVRAQRGNGPITILGSPLALAKLRNDQRNWQSGNQATAYKENADIGRYAGADVIESADVPIIKTATGSFTGGTLANGSNIISGVTITGGLIPAGTIINTGIRAVDPLTNQPLPYNKFVVTALDATTGDTSIVLTHPVFTWVAGQSNIPNIERVSSPTFSIQQPVDNGGRIIVVFAKNAIWKIRRELVSPNVGTWGNAGKAGQYMQYWERSELYNNDLLVSASILEATGSFGF